MELYGECVDVDAKITNIAAVDNETHLKALSHLTTILRDAANVQALLASKSYSEIKNIIQQEA